MKPISQEEAKHAIQLSPKRSKQYLHTRGYVREALSELWNVPALDIPLNAPPGKPPTLAKGWGHISFSHCCDGLLIGWSPKNIGVDIERADRVFKAEKVSKRYFSEKETKALATLSGEKLRTSVLKQWVAKEAAIKWQQGSLSMDLEQWYFNESSNLAIHQTLGYTIGINSFHYHSWHIAIAFNSKFHTNSIILCDELDNPI